MRASLVRDFVSHSSVTRKIILFRLHLDVLENQVAGKSGHTLLMLVIATFYFYFIHCIIRWHVRSNAFTNCGMYSTA